MTKNQVNILVDVYHTCNKKEGQIIDLLEIEDCDWMQDIRSNIFGILTENVQEDQQYMLGCALDEQDAETVWKIVTGLWREPIETIQLISDGKVVETIPAEKRKKLFKAEFAGEALIRAENRQQAEFNMHHNLEIKSKYVEINMCYPVEADHA